MCNDSLNFAALENEEKNSQKAKEAENFVKKGKKNGPQHLSVNLKTRLGFQCNMKLRTLE